MENVGEVSRVERRSSRAESMVPPPPPAKEEPEGVEDVRLRLLVVRWGERELMVALSWWIFPLLPMGPGLSGISCLLSSFICAK